MSDLQNSLNEILRQKNAYLLPENIKKDVTVLGITGTLESGGSGSGDVKLFESKTDMNNWLNIHYTEVEDGTKAVVYGELNVWPLMIDEYTQSFYVPETIVLNEQVTSNVEYKIRNINIDRGSSGTANGYIKPTSFSMSMNADNNRASWRIYV